jgi:hypothetical protein
MKMSEHISGDNVTKESFELEARILPPLLACADCPHSKTSLELRTFCTQVREQVQNGPKGITWGKTIVNMYAPIPNWCPLERLHKAGEFQ